MLTVKTLKGASWLVFSRVLGRAIDFFTLLVLARLLSPADFGIAALAVSLVAVIDMILEVPVTQALVRLPTIEKKHLDTGFTIGLARGLVVCGLVLLMAWPYAALNNEPVLLPLLGILALGPLSRGLVSPAMVNYARELGFHKTFILEISSKICATIVVFAVVLSGGGYWAIVANFVAISVASTISSYILAPYRPALSLDKLSSFSSFIGWFSLAQLVAALNWQFDRLLVGGLTSRDVFGRYALASDVAVFPTQTLIGPAMQAAMSAFSKINSEPDRVRHAFLKAARLVMLVSAPLCVGISLTADLATGVLLGPKWSEAAPLLALLAISVLPIPYYQLLNSVSLALDRPQTAFRLNVIDLVFRLLLISLGVYFASAIGASWARVALAFLMGFFYLVEVRRLLGIGVAAQLKNLWKMLLAIAAMTVVVQYMRPELVTFQLPVLVELLIVSAVGALTYGITLILLGARVSFRNGRPTLLNY
jgi:lipopolysaccharide exporter